MSRMHPIHKIQLVDWIRAILARMFGDAAVTIVGDFGRLKTFTLQ
jgi:hypothetical protein